MVELKWPVTKCESCGFDLREASPKASEKSNDANGKLKWTGFCPKCGRGYFVGDRELPKPTAEEIATTATQPVINKTALKLDESIDPEHQVTPGQPSKVNASGVPPDKRGAELAEKLDPEGLLQTPEAEVTPKTEGPAPMEGQYWCTQCAKIHNETSKVGKRHLKYREA